MDQRVRDWIGGLVCAAAVLLPGLAWAAAEGGHEGGGGLISLDKSLIVQAVNFIILLVILTKLLYKPFLAKMEERTQAIKKSLDEAQAARAEAARQQEENESRLRAAHAEAAAIRDQALREAADESRRHIEAAQAQSRKMVDDTKAQLDAEVRRAREELRREVADLATAVAEKLVRRSLREDDHRRIVAEAISKVGA
ncbi:MAG: F0F1 ATP synthase subunit B [Candidatus Rokubacteria bacterium]|nr:F0F1 ATP synthase subunit B [Candidatus Rokubacteria bacterium]MBI2492306.1 F0F1 ATP synthase subunit B [Candidatus Rokubacteria bacterium]MBI4255729.1 F0F1 ATP synthase subunit B [Candidatus Rokubacteria bacterium]MBI4627933.1 F0F1 ATP synthase subunit B [Candidatus Rokubacteria bacterium]